MAITELVTVKEASEILGCSINRVARMIREGKILTAFEAKSDGFVGRPGYRMYRSEIETIRIEHPVRRYNRRSKPNIEQRESSTNHEKIKKTLDELQVCLGLLNDLIGQLKEEL